jgi:hypothetical protein
MSHKLKEPANPPAAPTGTAGESFKMRAWLEFLLKSQADDLKFADTKAQYVLALAPALAGGLFGLDKLGMRFSNSTGGHDMATVLLSLECVAACIAIVNAALAVIPRYRVQAGDAVA